MDIDVEYIFALKEKIAKVRDKMIFEKMSADTLRKRELVDILKAVLCSGIIDQYYYNDIISTLDFTIYDYDTCIEELCNLYTKIAEHTIEPDSTEGDDGLYYKRDGILTKC